MKETWDANVDVLLGSDVGGGTSLSPFATMKAAYEIAYHKQDSNLIVQFLRTVLENGNSSTCFYYANIQIELLKFLLSYNLNQAVSIIQFFKKF